MKEIAKEIRNVVTEASRPLAGISLEEACFKETPESWSKKEILGHLINSAANNHQRFVRACYNAADNFPPYNQTEWVRIQGYQTEDWETLVTLWAVYNRHLCHLIERVPQDALSTPVGIGKEEPVALEAVIRDYLRHLKHHLIDLLA